MRLAGSVTVVVVAGLGMLAPPASASTAQLVDVVLPPECKYPPPSGVCPPGSATALVYRAGPGEANLVRVTGTAREVGIADRGADIQPGEGCRRLDRQSVSCSPPEGQLWGVFVDTGGGADRVTSAYGGVVVNGGAGNDVLSGGPFRDQLYGGRGADVVRGRGGDDRLYDASPRDPLGSGDMASFFPSPIESAPFDPAVVPLANPGRGRDSFDGGKGADSVSYEARVAGVTVDLADAAAPGAEDSVSDFEFALGGAGDDRLLGNRRSNWLDGREGDDRVAGRAGDDSLAGGGGHNLLRGGRGDDQVSWNPLSEAPNRLDCGPGRDRASVMSRDDFVDDDCEVLSFLTFGERLVGDVRSQLPLRSGDPPEVLSAALECLPFAAFAPDCEIRLELRVHGPAARGGTAPPRGTLLGSSSYTFAVSEAKVARLALSRRGLELLRRHRALRVRVTTVGDPPEELDGYLTVLRTP
jgi:RTX calcium-binding nonapeptide repeat (4 copies)